MAFYWRAHNGPLIAVWDPLSPHQLKKGIKFGPPMTKFSGYHLEGYFEYPQHMFWLRNKNDILISHFYLEG